MPLNLIINNIIDLTHKGTYWFAVAFFVVILFYCAYYIWRARKTFKPESELAWLISAGLIYAILTGVIILFFIYYYYTVF